MKITKFGHACLYIGEGEAKLLMDPGSYSEVPELDALHAILITHTHQDHLDIDTVKSLRAKHADAQIIACKEVGDALEKEGIAYTLIKDGEEVMVEGVSVRGSGERHSFIYGETPQCQNTGFIIANRLYYPGDSFHVPAEPIEILALPVAGPWMKTAECIDFAKEVKPKVVIPVHDAFMREDRVGVARMFPKMVLEPLGIEFRDMNDGSVEEF